MALTQIAFFGSQSDSEINQLFYDKCDAALHLRNNLVEGSRFYREGDTVDLLSLSCPGITPEELRILRDLGYLISVPIDGDEYYPAFQFNPDRGYLPYDSIKLVNDWIGDSRTAWAPLAWWKSPNRLLEGRTPEQFLGDPYSDEELAEVIALDAAA